MLIRGAIAGVILLFSMLMEAPSHVPCSRQPSAVGQEVQECGGHWLLMHGCVPSACNSMPTFCADTAPFQVELLQGRQCRHRPHSPIADPRAASQPQTLELLHAPQRKYARVGHLQNNSLRLTISHCCRKRSGHTQGLHCHYLDSD